MVLEKIKKLIPAYAVFPLMSVVLVNFTVTQGCPDWQIPGNIMI